MAFLTDKERNQLKVQHKRERDGRIRDRIKAVLPIDNGLKNWLQRYGFSYKKPAIVPGKANKEQQKEWLAE